MGGKTHVEKGESGVEEKLNQGAGGKNELVQQPQELLLTHLLANAMMTKRD